MMFRYMSLALLGAFIAPALAQTTTDCQPLNGTCPPDAALGMAFTWNMTNTTLDTSQNVWNVTAGTIGYNNNAAQFVMNKKGDAPTIKTNFKIFWGSVSLVMKAASGQGIISTLTMLSDDLDEIDWEFVGSNDSYIETNYFGKGNTTVYDRAIYVPVTDPRSTFHNYTVEWTPDWLVWMIDGAVMRNMSRGQADGHGSQYPQTPLDIQLGIWSAGDSDQPGTVEWAGGPTDWSQAPFTMEIQSVQINDYTKNVSAYTYTDRTGDSASIKSTPGQSMYAQTLSQPPSESISQKFNGLSSGAKIAIFASVGGLVFILASVCCFCCFKQRRIGRRERANADAEWDKSNSELMSYRTAMQNGNFSAGPPSPHPQYAPQKF